MFLMMMPPPVPERLASATRSLVDRALDREVAAVDEALAAVEAFGLVLLATGRPAVGPDELELHGLHRLPELAARFDGLGPRARGRSPWAMAAARRGRLWLGAPGAGSSGRRLLRSVVGLSVGPPRPGPLPEGLAGRPGAFVLAPAAAAAPRKPIAEGTLLQLLRGDLDGFRAAEVAREQVRTEAGRQELRWLVDMQGASPSLPRAEPIAARREVAAPPLLRLAAEGSVPLRDPAGGEPAGTAAYGRGKARLVVEAVRFADGVLALYASQPVTLALGAAEVPKAAGSGSRRRRDAGAGVPDAVASDVGVAGGEGTRMARARGGPKVCGQAPGYLELEGWAPGAPLALRAGEALLALKPLLARKPTRG